MPNKSKDKILKEFYLKFTHDWPPEWYTKEEARKHPKEAGEFLSKSLDIIRDEERKRWNKILVKFDKEANRRAGEKIKQARDSTLEEVKKIMAGGIGGKLRGGGYIIDAKDWDELKDKPKKTQTKEVG